MRVEAGSLDLRKRVDCRVVEPQPIDGAAFESGVRRQQIYRIFFLLRERELIYVPLQFPYCEELNINCKSNIMFLP